MRRKAGTPFLEDALRRRLVELWVWKETSDIPGERTKRHVGRPRMDGHGITASERGAISQTPLDMFCL